MNRILDIDVLWLVVAGVVFIAAVLADLIRTQNRWEATSAPGRHDWRGDDE